MVVLPVFPKSHIVMTVVGPIAAYLFWRWGIPRLRISDPHQRYRVLWLLVLLPVLGMMVLGIAPHASFHSPAPGFFFRFGPLRYHTTPFAVPAHRLPLTALPFPLIAIYLIHRVGLTFAGTAGVLEYLWTAVRIRRLPKYREDGVWVLRTPGWTSFTFGLVRPQIFISEEVWRSEHRQAVLIHEKAHVQRRDPRRRFVAQAVSRLLWIFPFWTRIADQLAFEAECICDSWACRMVGRAQYAGALLAFTEHAQSSAMSMGPLVTGFYSGANFVDGGSELMARARAIAEAEKEQTPPLFWPVFWLVYALIVILA